MKKNSHYDVYLDVQISRENTLKTAYIHIEYTAICTLGGGLHPDLGKY